MAIGQSASMEDYLEAITMLRKEKGAVRVTQISKMLHVKKPSVTAALQKLSQRGLVKHEKYGYVELTPEGKEISEDVFHRHEVLRHFMTEILGIVPDIAAEDACKMEHSLSQASLERLAKFVDFVLNCPQGKPEWLKGFEYYFEHGKYIENCPAKYPRASGEK